MTTGLSLTTIIALIRKEIDGAQKAKPGKDGKAGATGPKGERGPKGDTGPAGKQGPKGGDGKQGKAGPAGADGQDGADGVGIDRIEQDVDDAIVVHMTDGTIYTIEMPWGKNSTEVHYKVSGGGSGSGSGTEGTVDLSNYVQKPNSSEAWMVYKKGAGWMPVTTDLVATNPDVIFRNAKGQFASTKDLETLTNQLEVNRYFAEQLEAAGEPTTDARIADQDITNWNDSFGWGDHSEENYAKDVPPWDYEFTPDTLVLRDNNANIKGRKVIGQTFQMTAEGTTDIPPRPDDTIFYSSINNQLHKNSKEGMRASLGITGEHEGVNKGDDYRYLLASITTNISSRPGQMTLNSPDPESVTQISFYVTDADSKPSPHVSAGYFVELSHDGGTLLFKITGADSTQLMLVEHVSGDMTLEEGVTYDTNVYPILSSLWNGSDFRITGTYHSQDGNFVGSGFGLKFDGDSNSIVPIAANGNPKVGIDLGSTAAKFKDGDFTGDVRATAFIGDGSQLTGLPKIWTGTQAQYDALSPDPSTLYFIT